MLVSIRFLQLYYFKYGWSMKIIYMNKLIFLLMGLPISEYDKYNPKLKNRYIIFHSIWHMTIFVSMNTFLSKFIY